MKRQLLPILTGICAYLILSSTSIVAQTYTLDSIVANNAVDSTNIIYPYNHDNYTYDENGNQLLHVGYEWNSTTKHHELSYKEEQIFTNGNRTSYIAYTWDGTVYNPLQKTESTYDGNNAVHDSYSWIDSSSSWNQTGKYETYSIGPDQDTTQISYQWVDSTSSWEQSYKTTYAYSPAGLLLNYKYYDWDADNSLWVISSQSISYFTGNNRDSTVVTVFSAGSAVPSSKTEWLRDANGNDTSYYYMFWNTSTNMYDPYSKNTRVFDANGNSIEYTYFWWNGANYAPQNRTVNTFDASNNNTSYVGYYWVDSTSSWLENYKGEYVYDINNNLQEDYRYSWNSDSSNWTPTSKSFNYLSLDIDYANLYLPEETDYDLYEHANQLDSNISFQYQNGTWVKTEEILFHFSELVGGINATTGNINVSVYPNPSSQFIAFDSDLIQGQGFITVFDAQGRKAMQTSFSSKDQIRVQDLPHGNYIFKIINKGRVFSGKFHKN